MTPHARSMTFILVLAAALLAGCQKCLPVRVTNRFSVPVTVVNVQQLPPLGDESRLMTVPPGETGYVRCAMTAHQLSYRLSFRDPSGRELARIVQSREELRRDLQMDEWRLTAGPAGVRSSPRESLPGADPSLPFIARVGVSRGGAGGVVALPRAVEMCPPVAPRTHRLSTTRKKRARRG